VSSFFPQIPDTFAIGVQTCLDKCKIQRTAQPKTQQQPRVVGNGFPAPNNTRRDNEENLNKRAEAPETPEFSEVPVTRPSTISTILASANAQTLEEIAFLLKAVIGVLLTGYVLAWVYFVVPAWRNRRLQASPIALAQDVKA
jgi:hypothetical protein